MDLFTRLASKRPLNLAYVAFFYTLYSNTNAGATLTLNRINYRIIETERRYFIRLLCFVALA